MSTMYRSEARPSRWLLVLPVIVAAGLVAAFLLAGLFYRTAAPADTQYPWAGWWWFPGWFFLFPVFFLIFFGLRWFFWGWWGWGWAGYRGYYGDSAIQTLRERFARGEMTREQYEQMLRDLQSGRV